MMRRLPSAAFYSLKKLHARTFAPFADNCVLVAVWDSVVAFKSAEMVYAHYVVGGAGGAQAGYPPVVAAFFHNVPAVEGLPQS